MNWLVDHAREPERLESECDLVRAGDAVGSVHGTGGDGKEDLLDGIGADVRCVRVVGAVLWRGSRRTPSPGRSFPAERNDALPPKRGLRRSSGILRGEVACSSTQTATRVRCHGARALDVVCTSRRREDDLVVALVDAVLLVDTSHRRVVVDAAALRQRTTDRTPSSVDSAPLIRTLCCRW